MPSVGMRRSTRVFVPKSGLKDVDGATVLRSGKRLWSLSSGDGKSGRGGREEEWFPVLQSSNLSASADDSNYKSNSRTRLNQKNDISVKKSGRKVGQKRSRSKSNSKSKSYENVSLSIEENNQMYGNGYDRKRRRLTEKRNDFSSSGNRVVEDRMFGIQFVRKHRRKTTLGSSSIKISNQFAISEVNIGTHDLAGNSSLLDKKDESLNFVSKSILDVIIEPSHYCAQRFTSFLVSILNFMRRSSVGGSKLAVFMCSDPISQVFSRHGIHFSHDLRGRNNTFLTGICKFWEAQDFVPMFSLNFSASPHLFTNLHFRMFLRSQYQLAELSRYLIGLSMKPKRVPDIRNRLSSISNEMGLSLNKIMTSLRSRKRAGKLHGRNFPSGERRRSIRHNTKSRNIKKKASRRSSRVRTPSVVCLPKSVHEVANTFDTGNVPSTNSSNKQKKQFQSGSCSNNIIKELNQNVDSMCCDGNILVIETDRCYREKEAKITLECSASKEWYLAVKIGGTVRYMHKAHEVMKTSTTNRFTHAMIWTSWDGWKLEFFDRREWFIFKELHKECVNRNVQAASAMEVPVPGIHEVGSHVDEGSIPFVRPSAYIKMHNDEVTRAVMRKTANYDMDSGDEEWLKDLNNDFLSKDDGSLIHVSDEKFEEMIDVFEKAAYCTPDDVSNENGATKLCSDLKTDMVTSVYQYWVEKRKRKDSALLRVFQCAPPRLTHVLQKPFLRKRRSFKRQASRNGNGNQRSFLQAFADEQEQDTLRRVEKAKDAEIASIEVAILKRKKAQELMEIADLAMYKATLALKIAEAAELAVPMDSFVSDILE